MFIHIITDHNSVVSNTQITDNLQLCQGEDLTQGVVGVVQDDSLGPGGEAIGQGLLVKSSVTGAVSILTRWLDVLCYKLCLYYYNYHQRDEDRSPPSNPNHWLITVKERLDNNNLVTRIDMTH